MWRSSSGASASRPAPRGAVHEIRRIALDASPRPRRTRGSATSHSCVRPAALHRAGARPGGASQRIRRPRAERPGAGPGRAATGAERLLPAAHRLGFVHPGAPEPVLRAPGQWPRRSGTGGMQHVRASSRAPHRGATGFPGISAGVREQLGPVRRSRQRPAVRAGEHLSARPLLLPESVHWRAGERPGPGGGGQRPKREARLDVGAGRAAAGRHRGLLRRGTRRPPGRDRAGITRAGGHHAEPGTACTAGRQPVRVRSVARQSDARQSATRGDPAAGGSRHRLLPAQEPSQPAAGSAARADQPSGGHRTGANRPARQAGGDAGRHHRRRQGAGAPGGRGGHLSGGTSPRGAGAAAGLRCRSPRITPHSAIRTTPRPSAPTTSPTGWWRSVSRFPFSPAVVSRATSPWPKRVWSRRACACARRGSWPSSTRGTPSSSSRRRSLPGRQAPAPKNRPTVPTRSRRSATARASRPRPSSTTFGSSWPRPRPIGPRPHATSRWRACGSRCCPRSRSVPPRAAPPTTTGAPTVNAPGGQTGSSPTTPYQPPRAQAQGILSSVQPSGVVGP